MHFKMNRTNGETRKWINSQKNLSLWAGFEEANTFSGLSRGTTHKTFGTWKESFHRKEKKNFCFYLQTTFAARVQGGLVLVLSIQHFRLLVVLVTKSTVSICSLKVTWWFYGYLNAGWWQNCWSIEGRWWWWWWYIYYDEVCVCLSRKIITSHIRADRRRCEVSRLLGLVSRRPALA